MALYNTFPIKFGREDNSSSYDIKWLTNEYTSASGQRRACSHQLYPAITFNLNYNAMSLSELKTLMSFYNSCQGSLTPFYYADFYLSATSNVSLAYAEGKRILTIDIGGTRYPCPYATTLKDVTVNNVPLETLPVIKTSGDTAYIEVPGDTESKLVTATYIAFFKVKFKTLKTKEVANGRFNVSVTLEAIW